MCSAIIVIIIMSLSCLPSENLVNELFNKKKSFQYTLQIKFERHGFMDVILEILCKVSDSDSMGNNDTRRKACLKL